MYNDTNNGPELLINGVLHSFHSILIKGTAILNSKFVGCPGSSNFLTKNYGFRGAFPVAYLTKNLKILVFKDNGTYSSFEKSERYCYLVNNGGHSMDPAAWSV